jgi:hypothetical protein
MLIELVQLAVGGRQITLRRFSSQQVAQIRQSVGTVGEGAPGLRAHLYALSAHSGKRRSAARLTGGRQYITSWLLRGSARNALPKTLCPSLRSQTGALSIALSAATPPANRKTKCKQLLWEETMRLTRVSALSVVSTFACISSALSLPPRDGGAPDGGGPGDGRPPTVICTLARSKPARSHAAPKGIVGNHDDRRQCRSGRQTDGVATIRALAG